MESKTGSKENPRRSEVIGEAMIARTRAATPAALI